MKRLNSKNGNNPAFTYEIFVRRWEKELQYVDWARFIMMADQFEGGKFLDLGVFNSPLIIELQKNKKFRGSEFVGIDYCEPVLRELQQRHPAVRYVVADVTAIPFKDEHFDYIVAGELLEHMEDPAKAVKEAMRVLKKGGTLAISVPAEEDEGNLVSKEHLWSFTEQDIEELLKEYGEVEISTYEDTVEHFVAYCTKK